MIFSYVVQLDEIGYLLIERLVSVGYMAFFFMLLLSSFIITFTILFRSNETEYLFTTPVSPLALFASKFIDSILFSSWTVLAMALPILLAYANVRDYGFWEYALVVPVVLVPFVLIPVTLGTLLSIIAVYGSKRIDQKKLVLGGICTFTLLIYLFIRYSAPTDLEIPFTEDFRGLNLFINNFRLNSHPFTPNFWLIQCLRSVSFRNFGEFGLYAAALISTAALGMILVFTVADQLFFKTWLISMEKSIEKQATSIGTLHPKEGVFTKPTDSQFRALLNKDIILFIREPSQWAQLFLIVALVMLYFVNLSFIPDDSELDQWKTVLTVMNFVFCGLVIATMSIRFIFPLYSLEGTSNWILNTSPVKPTTIFREKFWLSFIPFLIIAEVIAFATSSILHFDGFYQWITYSGIFMMSIALSSMGVGFGVAFPEFGETSPSRIASSPGGVLTIILSIAYIAIMATIIGILSTQYTSYLIAGDTLSTRLFIGLTASSILLTLVAIVVPLMVGIKSLRTPE